MHQVADDLDHAINGIAGELRRFELDDAPRGNVLAHCREHLDVCREHLDVLRRVVGEIVDDLHLH